MIGNKTTSESIDEDIMKFSTEIQQILTPQQKASNCVECGLCETHCPQGILIREELKNVKAIFEGNL